MISPVAHRRRCSGRLATAFFAIGAVLSPVASSNASANHTTIRLMAIQLGIFGSPTHEIVITAAGDARSAALGKWKVDYPTEPRSFTVALTLSGGQLTGSVVVGAGADAQNVAISEGRLNGNTIVFKVNSPGGNRTLTFTGTISGDRMTVTREVTIGPGGTPGGQGIFGARGATSFAASRMR